MDGALRDTVDECVRIDIRDWMIRTALTDANEIEILAGVCERLNARGMGLARASVANNLLDPTFDGRGVRWLREQGGLDERFIRTEDSRSNENWMRSPFAFLIDRGEPVLRRRLDATYHRGEFPMLDGFQDAGITDYVAFASRV